MTNACQETFYTKVALKQVLIHCTLKFGSLNLEYFENLTY